MEIGEFLNQSEVKIITTAKELERMLDKYMNKYDFDYNKAFKNIQVTRNGDEMSSKLFLSFIKDNEDKIKSIDNRVTDLSSAVCYVINQVIVSKNTFIEEKTAQRVAESTRTPEYYKDVKPSDEPIEIFNIIDGRANEHDKDLYKCFCNAGDHVVFTSTDMTKLITQNNDGSLAFGNDLLSMSEGALYDCICKAMRTEYTSYKNDLLAKIAEVTHDDLDIEESSTPVIEKIFLEEVPCSFRHIVTICKTYEKGADNKTHFAGFKVKPNKKIVESLEFDSFITALSKNFQRMTRGALKHQAEYKAFSNDLNEAAVSHWILPSENCWKKAMLPDKWKEYLSGKAEPRIMRRLLWYIGAMQDANNKAEQALVISDGGDTGKSTLLSILQKLFPKDFFGYITNSTLDDHKDFALSERRAYEHHCLILDEYDGKSINSPVFKNLIGTKVPISMPVKNKQAIEHNFTGTKMIIVSNEVSVLETHAYRRRVIPISFRCNHDHKTVFSDKDINELVETGKDFLNFCFKVYKTCKLMKPNGEYIVLSPDEEKRFLDDKPIDMKAETISLKAISDDEEISEYFNVHDYDNSDISMEFKEFIDRFFDKTEDKDDYITVKEFNNIIQKIWSTAKTSDAVDYARMFGNAMSTIRVDEMLVTYVNTSSKDWWKFKEVMKTVGFVNNIVRPENSDEKPTKAWRYIKFKGYHSEK